MTLDEFIGRIDGFVGKKPSEQILYFGFYLTRYAGQPSFRPVDILLCFEQSSLPPYSNVATFLSREFKAKRVLRSKDGSYTLARNVADEMAAKVGDLPVKAPSADMFPLELFSGTRKYLENTAKQVILCYDYGFYDACLVMTRRLIETLIIEIFERNKISDKIKKPGTDHYYMCGDLIDVLLKEKSWTLGRDASKALPVIKSKADNCAHNRRYNAKKADIDNIQSGLRVVLEELIHLANFEH